MFGRLFKNHLLTTFLPWIFFSSVVSHSILFASFGALAFIFIFNFHELRKGFVMPICSAIFFLLIGLNHLFKISTWIDGHLYLLINSALAAIVLISMLIGKPFTLQYAKERVARETWNKPLFLRINWILTSIWLVLMIIMAIPSYVLTQEQILSSWFWRYGLTIICIFVGIRCNEWIPKLLGKNQ